MSIYMYCIWQKFNGVNHALRWLLLVFAVFSSSPFSLHFGGRAPAFLLFLRFLIYRLLFYSSSTYLWVRACVYVSECVNLNKSILAPLCKVLLPKSRSYKFHVIIPCWYEKSLPTFILLKHYCWQRNLIWLWIMCSYLISMECVCLRARPLVFVWMCIRKSTHRKRMEKKYARNSCIYYTLRTHISHSESRTSVSLSPPSVSLPLGTI